MKQIVILLVLLISGCTKAHPKPIFVDVDRLGYVSLDQHMIALTNLPAMLNEKSHSSGADPVVIRGAPQVEHKFIRAVLQICNRNGYSNLILANPDANQRSLRPWLSTDPTQKRHQFQLYQQHEPFSLLDEVTNTIPKSSLCVFVFADAFVANGKRMNAEKLTTELNTFIKTPGDNDKQVFIMCTFDSSNGQLVWLLNVCAEQGLKQIFLTSI